MESIEQVELVAGSVRLRPWRPDDIDDVWAALQDPDIRLWNGGGVASRDEAVALLGRRSDWSSGTHASWAMVDGADAVLGSVSVHSIDRDQAGAEIGYWVAPAARGRGVAAVAVDAACRWAFRTPAIDRIELCHAVDNPASGRVAQKAGFRYEGHLRRSHRYGDGVKHDEALWARLSDDPALPALGLSR